MLRLLWSLDLSHRKTRARHPQRHEKAQQAFKKILWATDGRAPVGFGVQHPSRRPPMEISSSTLPTVAAERGTMFVALELSKSSWLVALHSPVADKVSLHRFVGGDVAGLLALIARKQAQAEARLGRTIRVLSCYEAGYDGIWLHRLLCARGIDNRILDAASILVDRRSRRAKTDRLDAAGLLRTLMALDRGESRVCRVVRVPSMAQEDARHRSRERTRLVVERGQHSNRIKGVLMTLGVRDFEPTRRDWQERLGGLRTADDRELPACLKAAITRECQRLHQVIVMWKTAWKSDPALGVISIQ